MGLDVNLYATGEVSDDKLRYANEYARARGVVCDFGKPRDTPFYHEPHADENAPRIEWRTLTRYYGKGYERGHWPSIANAIECMRQALDGCTIHYGSDIEYDAPEVTDDRLSELWTHWYGPDGDAYRRPR